LILGGVLILSDFELLPWLEIFLLFWAFLSSSLLFCLACPLFLPFSGFCGFPYSRWPSWAFRQPFGFLAMLHGVLDSNFKLCTFVVDGLIKGEIEKPSGQFLGLIVMSHWLGEVWIRIRDNFICFTFIFVSLENHVCLSRGVQVAGAAWRAATRIMAGVGECRGLGMVAQVEYLVAGRSRGRVVLCTVCTVHVEMRSASFLV
jgi:hypothetical protein